jgi:hypothetical protein
MNSESASVCRNRTMHVLVLSDVATTLAQGIKEYALGTHFNAR